MSVRFSKIRKFHFNFPQRIAALLLALFLMQCLWSIHHQPLTEQDYDYARCGRETWERPSSLTGYFTTCGNIRDGVLTYRLAGLPLSIEIMAERGLDHFRKPEDRVFIGTDGRASSWELRHQLTNAQYLLRFPFVLAGLILGGELWWVTRRLFGNLGGYTALALFCFSPDLIRACTSPNAEILSALGLFAFLYTAIGVAHAMQGPQRKWRPRILLLTATFCVVASAHIAAFPWALLLGFLFMLWLAEGRRAFILPVLLSVTLGSFLFLFACYAFSFDAFSYLFRSEAGKVWVSFRGVGEFFGSFPNAGLALAAGAAFVLYLSERRSRYFGNTTPFLVGMFFFLLATPGVPAQPWLWAQPFLLTFVAGVFADAYETKHRKVFLSAAAVLVFLQAALSVARVSQLLP